WHACKKPFGHLHGIAFHRRPTALIGKSHVTQDRATSTPTVLKSNQTGVLNLRPTQIEFLESLFLGFLNGLPKQEGRTSQIVKIRVGGAILINDRVLVGHREDTGDRLPIL